MNSLSPRRTLAHSGARVRKMMPMAATSPHQLRDCLFILEVGVTTPSSESMRGPAEKSDAQALHYRTHQSLPSRLLSHRKERSAIDAQLLKNRVVKSQT